MSMEKPDKKYLEHFESLKIHSPEGLEEAVISHIEKRDKARSKYIGLVSAAAALVLLLTTTLLFLPGRSTEMDYGEKLITLVEAYKLFPVNEITIEEEEVLYEDETIIIYYK